MRIVAISDLHYSQEAPEPPTRLGALADILFERAVNQVNRLIKPDVTVLMGDLVDAGGNPGAEALLRRLKSIADKLECAVIALPGNHDGDPEAFYRVFPRPDGAVDASGARFLVFLDPEEPGYNARRSAKDLARMAATGPGHTGPVVMLQHCSLFPPESTACPFNYVNADDIVAAMRKHAIPLAISGHFHPGANLVRHDAGSFIIAPALCEAPFPFLEISIHGRSIRVTRHELRLPPEYGLVDCHVHTPFAYCNEDMDLGRAIGLADEFGLGGLVFAEHSGQLYYDAETYWRGAFLSSGIGATCGRDDRMSLYLARVGKHCPPATLGLEVDCDHAGRPVVHTADRQSVSVLVGAIHRLPELDKPQPNPDCVADEFLGTLSRFLRSGIHIYAHPFRVLRRLGRPVPESLFKPTVRLLRESGVALELNFHTDEPPPEFVRLCLNSGVRLALGSDAHSLCAVGELWPHLRLLRQCGCDSDPRTALAEVSFRRP